MSGMADQSGERQSTITRRVCPSRAVLLSMTIIAASPWISGMPLGVASAQQEYTLGADDTWKQGQAPDPATPEGQLAEARAALAAKDYERARTIASDWIEQHPQHLLIAEAYLIRADALVGDGDEYKALYDYEYIARMYAGSEVFVAALERELAIAKRYADGYKRKLWGLRMVGAGDEAEELFIRVQERLPGSRL